MPDGDFVNTKEKKSLGIEKNKQNSNSNREHHSPRKTRYKLNGERQHVLSEGIIHKPCYCLASTYLYSCSRAVAPRTNERSGRLIKAMQQRQNRAQEPQTLSQNMCKLNIKIRQSQSGRLEKTEEALGVGVVATAIVTSRGSRSGSGALTDRGSRGLGSRSRRGKGEGGKLGGLGRNRLNGDASARGPGRVLESTGGLASRTSLGQEACRSGGVGVGTIAGRVGNRGSRNAVSRGGRGRGDNGASHVFRASRDIRGRSLVASSDSNGLLLGDSDSDGRSALSSTTSRSRTRSGSSTLASTTSGSRTRNGSSTLASTTSRSGARSRSSTASGGIAGSRSSTLDGNIRANGVARLSRSSRGRTDGDVLGSVRSGLDGCVSRWLRLLTRVLGHSRDGSLIALGNVEGLVDGLSRSDGNLSGNGMGRGTSANSVDKGLSGNMNLLSDGGADSLNGRLDCGGLRGSSQLGLGADGGGERDGAGDEDGRGSRAVGLSLGAASGSEDLSGVDDRGHKLNAASGADHIGNRERESGGGEDRRTSSGDSGNAAAASAREGRHRCGSGTWKSGHRGSSSARESGHGGSLRGGRGSRGRETLSGRAANTVTSTWDGGLRGRRALSYGYAGAGGGLHNGHTGAGRLFGRGLARRKRSCRAAGAVAPARDRWLRSWRGRDCRNGGAGSGSHDRARAGGLHNGCTGARRLFGRGLTGRKSGRARSTANTVATTRDRRLRGRRRGRRGGLGDRDGRARWLLGRGLAGGESCGRAGSTADAITPTWNRRLRSEGRGSRLTSNGESSAGREDSAGAGNLVAVATDMATAVGIGSISSREGGEESNGKLHHVDF